MSKVLYGCPKCGSTSIRYDYGLRVSICIECKTPFKDFQPLPDKTKKRVRRKKE